MRTVVIMQCLLQPFVSLSSSKILWYDSFLLIIPLTFTACIGLINCQCAVCLALVWKWPCILQWMDMKALSMLSTNFVSDTCFNVRTVQLSSGLY